MRTATRRMAALAAVITLIGAACGGDGEGGLFGTTEGTASQGATTSSGDRPTTTQARPTTTQAGPATTSGGDVTPPGAGDIEDLLERYENAAVRLTYEVDDGDDMTILVLSQDPQADPPVSSYTFSDDGGKMIQRGDELIICEESECFAMPGMGADGMLMMGMFGSAFVGALLMSGGIDAPGYDVDTSPISIAGRDGVCITYSPSPAMDPTVESARQCVDNELGFTLLLESTDRESGETETVMRLLEFDRPRPEDFEPTGPVTGMPTP